MFCNVHGVLAQQDKHIIYKQMCICQVCMLKELVLIGAHNQNSLETTSLRDILEN